MIILLFQIAMQYIYGAILDGKWEADASLLLRKLIRAILSTSSI